MEKTCCACGLTLPLGGFGKDKRNPDGLVYRCIECMRKYKSAYREAHKDEISEYLAEYYEEHKEEKASYDAKYRKENREARNKNNARFREEHREEINKKSRENYRQNREKELERGKAYRTNNQEKESVRAAKYLRNNRETYNANTAKRKALKMKQTPVDASFKKIQFYYTVCSETNEILCDTFFNVDHIQPLSRGGLHHEKNLQILEGTLNFQKNNKWPLSDKEQIKYKGVIL